MFSTETDVGELLKAAFRRYPTGVAVISAAGPDGLVGLTASSVASVSLDPPALSFSVLRSWSARAIRARTFSSIWKRCACRRSSTCNRAS